MRESFRDHRAVVAAAAAAADDDDDVGDDDGLVVADADAVVRECRDDFSKRMAQNWVRRTDRRTNLWLRNKVNWPNLSERSKVKGNYWL